MKLGPADEIDVTFLSSRPVSNPLPLIICGFFLAVKMLTVSSHLTGEPPALLQLRCHQDDDAKGDDSFRLKQTRRFSDSTTHL
jgi:hypothetical protein